MKRLVISFLLILLLTGLSALHVSHLQSLTDGLISQLEEVKDALNHSGWVDAQAVMDDIFQQWEKHGFYLHTLLRHTDIDGIRSSLKEAQAYLERQEDIAECLAVTARLINQLELLLEAELPTLKNLL
jgi:hypothetical protein